MAECNRATGQHKGRSSEELLDKGKIIQSLNITEGQTILDAGCGSGYMAREFARLVKDSGRVYALDSNELAIKNLMSTLDTDIIEAFVSDVSTTTKLGASTIDLIYLSNVVHIFSDAQMQGFVTEVKRLLKPKGMLAIVEIKKEETPFGPPQHMRLSPDELTERIPLSPKETVNINDYFYLQLFEK
ncbi:MAG: methyltransferase domain-containing protein [Deltaproteobacteria bacterium]|nr:methyltransferase domain-containing protein [Deltaproteobacteria bacterium]